jgi:phosphoribosylaminoimidazolecarboxamide formyltransferase/IMP cyclohydrolase
MIATVTRKTVTDRITVRRILISVSDKRHLDRLLAALATSCPGAEIVATGGTLSAIRQLLAPAGTTLAVTPIEDHTGYPEMPGGLVKTLHPRIHGGLLADTDDADQAAYCADLGIVPFDLAVVNLYPFVDTVAKAETTLEMARRQIDIGGPTMIRAAAKNFLRVAAAVDPDDYDALAAELAAHDGTLGVHTRWQLARKAFLHVTQYDQAISGYLADQAWQEVVGAYDVR